MSSQSDNRPDNERDKKTKELFAAVEGALKAFLTDNGAKKDPPALNDYIESIEAVKSILTRLVARSKVEADKIKAEHDAKVKNLQAQLERAISETASIGKAVEYLNKSA